MRAMPAPARLPALHAVAYQASPDEDRLSLLARSLEAAHFWEVLAWQARRSHLAPADLPILIKVDLRVFDYQGPTGTDPRLVEALIDLLHARGYPRVAVADAQDDTSLWLENREVPILADLAGYRFETDAGHAYEVLDLSEAQVPAEFPAGSVLAASTLAQPWLEAGFRISFAKCRTDEAQRFWVGVHNLRGALPLRNKAYHYGRRLEGGAALRALLAHTPVHFALLDAWESNHGSQGSRAPHPLATRSLIASPHLLLADWVAAFKMGQDPHAAPLLHALLQQPGLPARYQLGGDLAPWPGWQPVSHWLAESVRRRDENLLVQRLVRPWLQTVNTDLFPFRHLLDQQVNQVLAPLFADPGAHPLAQAALAGFNYLLGQVQQGLHSWQVVYDKDRLRQQAAPLNIDPDAFSRRDFEAVVPYIDQLLPILEATPPDANGLPWRYLDGSVLFRFVRRLPYSFAHFVEQVDIGRAVQWMYDNTGGQILPVRHDAQGRVRHQIERNLYLPQPNWMAFFGGKPIDVTKLEVLRRTKTVHRIYWRTVASENGSASFDDGMVSFQQVRGGTEVTIIARQQFTLPLFWQALDMDNFPRIKDALVSDAYVRFFSRTLANYEAAYEGRDPRLGRPWDPAYGEGESPLHALPLEQLQELVGMLAGLLGQGGKQTAQPGYLDADGYRHFGPGSSAGGAVQVFLQELGEAMRQDARYFAGGGE